MEFDTGRRRFLELAGTGTALSLAGCNALQENSGTTTGTASGGDSTVGVAVAADQEELQQRQQEIKSELQAGNISRREAQQQYRSAQAELRGEAVTSFAERAASESKLAVEDSVDQLGVLLVSGPATALIDALSFETVNALLPKTAFERAKSQASTETTTSN